MGFAARMNLHLDFETRSAADLKKIGVHAYAEHPTTEILCASYAIDDGPVQRWWPGCNIHLEWLFREALIGAQPITAHNSQFERLILNGPGARRYGLPQVPIEKFRCTMVMAYALGLPGALDDAAAAVGLFYRKDQVGYRLMLAMCKPRRPRKGELGDKLLWRDSPEDRERLMAYCDADVEAERALEKRLLPLAPRELELWFLDQRINDRGVLVDAGLAEAAVKIVDDKKRELDARMLKASEFEVRSVTDLTNLVGFARRRGCPDVDSLAKDRLAELLVRDDLDPALRECLEIRQEGAKASVSKIDALLRSRCADGRGRGFLQFHAANTGRWAGRRFQPQNLKRPTHEDDDHIAEIIRLVRRGRWEPIDELMFGPALSAIGDIIRGMVQAPDGKAFTAADYSNIEGRVLAWLAGEKWKLDAFRAYDAGTGPDLYKLAYGRSFGVDVKAVTKQQRQVGKVMELALGYAGGVGAFLIMAKGYGLKVGDFYEEVRATGGEAFEDAAKAFEGRGRGSGVERKTWIAAETLKLLWRAAHPRVVQFWKDAEDGALAALDNPGSIVTVGRLKFKKAGSWLFMRLPSGRAMAYPYPEAREVPYFGKTKRALTYKTVPDPLKPQKLLPESDGSINMKWARISTYGGMLAENATQAVARDILREGIFNVEAAGYPVVLHVHDEAVSEAAEGFGSVEEYERLMVKLPAVYEGLPVTAAGFRAGRYRK